MLGHMFPPLIKLVAELEMFICIVEDFNFYPFLNADPASDIVSISPAYISPATNTFQLLRFLPPSHNPHQEPSFLLKCKWLHLVVTGGIPAWLNIKNLLCNAMKQYLGSLPACCYCIDQRVTLDIIAIFPFPKRFGRHYHCSWSPE